MDFVEATQPLITVEFSQEESNDLDENILSLHRKKPVACLLAKTSDACFNIYEGTNFVGRDDSCQIVLNSKALSKRHACIEVTSGDHLIYDLNSLNKTKLRSKTLQPEIRYELSDGAKITFGDVVCIYSKVTKETVSQSISTNDTVNKAYKSVLSSLLANHFTDDDEYESSFPTDEPTPELLPSNKNNISFENSRSQHKLPRFEEKDFEILAQDTPCTFVALKATTRKRQVLDESQNLNDCSARVGPLAVPESESLLTETGRSSLILRLSEDDDECLVTAKTTHQTAANKIPETKTHRNEVEGRITSQKDLTIDPADKGRIEANERHSATFVEKLSASESQSKKKPRRKDPTKSIEIKTYAKKAAPRIEAPKSYATSDEDDVPLKALVLAQKNFATKTALADSSIRISSEKRIGKKRSTDVKTVPKKPKLKLKEDSDSEDDEVLQFVKNRLSRKTSGRKNHDKSSRKRKLLNDDDDDHSLAYFKARFKATQEKPKNTDSLSDDEKLCNVGKTKNVKSTDVSKGCTISFTGYDEQEFVDFKQIAHEVGAKVTESAKECSCLVADKIKRTTKLLCAVARGIPIVTSTWLKHWKANAEVVNINEYALRDETAEKQYNFKLKRTLELAVKKPLFTDFSVFVTPSVKPVPNQMSEIIECAGGKFLDKFPNKRTCTRNTVIISCKEDYDKFKSHAKTLGVPVVNSEFILTGILRYKTDIEPYRMDK